MKKNEGFTLIELLVTISIIAIVSAVVFGNGGLFNSKLAVSSVAEDISLAIRDVQSYGSSVSEASSGSGQFNAGYGIVFSFANPAYAIEFADRNGDKLYTTTGGCGVAGDECIKKVIFRNGVTIGALCAVASSGVSQCSQNFGSIVITFLRPSLDATITVLNNSGTVISGPWISGTVELGTVQQGSLKWITISSTGQVSIQ